jgi:hypothetical protein
MLLPDNLLVTVSLCLSTINIAKDAILKMDNTIMTTRELLRHL